ncbi:LysM peptidoglycan-binding domain-containing protein [Nocardia sp. XZ_19_385]|uniref:LysM peptidoglycan-binding domain-containing protein n=1 Tax=Nocardia sp. XZ_19_385 TaxID=2769488 RepID=UPI00188F13A2|nr:LysM peptidoglycan-binding domain-containing protein [Nocardia sp. XZ_19_385]
MGDTLRVGEELGLGQSLTNGAYTLALQPDGNLVLSEPGGNVVWAAQTHGQDVQKAVLQQDGNFVVYKGDGSAAWSTETNGKSVDRLTVQPDRNVVLYGADGGAVWATDTKTDNPIEAPAAEPAAAPPAEGGRSYTVEPGDTMWAIAERFLGDGNRYQEIADASGIDNPDSIQPGQELKIP